MPRLIAFESEEQKEQTITSTLHSLMERYDLHLDRNVVNEIIDRAVQSKPATPSAAEENVKNILIEELEKTNPELARIVEEGPEMPSRKVEDTAEPGHEQAPSRRVQDTAEEQMPSRKVEDTAEPGHEQAPTRKIQDTPTSEFQSQKLLHEGRTRQKKKKDA